MAGWIPDEKLSEIRNASDIVEIVSESVILKKAGKNFIGLCPFHSEKTPSFTVNPEKQIFHCFGCGTGGNVFSFLMKHRGYTFPETVDALARRSGISIPQKTTQAAHRMKKSERERIGDANRLAMEFYQRVLHDDSTGEAARRYLKKRGITERTIKTFRIGFSPGEWDRLANDLDRQGIPQAVAFKSGLVIPGKRGGGYDRFRNRIIFPIADLGGRVIGFGGRVLDDALPKYINSPETPLFNKSRSLYGLDLARKACRDTDAVHIVEGYFDVITLQQQGIPNVVATLGTGLTADHILLLKGFARRFFMVFDPDSAGIKAVERVIPALIRENVSARVVSLPEGKDPDAFVMGNGHDAFHEVASRSLPIMTYLIESAKTRHGLSPSGKSRVVSELENVLALIDDGVNRSIYLKEVAEMIGIEEIALIDRIRRLRWKGVPGDVNRNDQTGKRMKEESAEADPLVRFEEKIISMMLQFPSIIPEIQEKQILERFIDKDMKAIGGLILMYGGDPDVLVPEIISKADNADWGMRIAQLAATEDLWNTDGCLKLIAQYESLCTREEKTSLNARIQAAQNQKDPALIRSLLEEKQRMAQAKE